MHVLESSWQDLNFGIQICLQILMIAHQIRVTMEADVWMGSVGISASVNTDLQGRTAIHVGILSLYI